MQALQGGLIGISTRRLRSHIRAKAGCELDSAQFRVSSYASGGPWRGVKAWTPGRNLLISLPQQSDLKRAAAGNAIGSASPGDGSGLDSNPSSSSATSTSTSASKSDDSFCIIEGRDTVRDFAQLQLQEIRDNINSRRNKIFLLMEEVRRLRIQQRIKKEAEKGGVANPGTEDDSEMLDFKSSIPFLPELSSSSLQQYYATCFGLVSGIILFGGLLAPVLELKLGLGGTSYADFINSMHLPSQLSQVGFFVIQLGNFHLSLLQPPRAYSWPLPCAGGPYCGILLRWSSRRDIRPDGGGSEQCDAARSQAVPLLRWHRLLSLRSLFRVRLLATSRQV